MAAPDTPPADPADSWTHIWALSWPLLLTMGITTLNLLIDSWMAGRIGPAAQAAVSLADQFAFIYIATTAVVTIGVTAIVARAVGAGDWDQANGAVGQAFWMAAGIAVGLGLPMYLLAPMAISHLGVTTTVSDLARLFLHLTIVAVPALAGIGVANALLRAIGDSRGQLWVTVGQTVTMVAVESLGLALGWGVAGLAFGVICGNWTGLLIALRRLQCSRLASGFRRMARPDGAWLGRIARIGLPAGTQGLLRSLSSVAFSAIVAQVPNNTAALASLTIGMRVESLGFLPAFALSLAASTLVGQALGAQKPERARQAAWRTIGSAVALTLPISFLFIVGGAWIAATFSQDPVVQTQTTNYLFWMGVSEPFLAASIAGNGVLQGAGDTRFPMINTLIGHYLVRLPLAYGFVRIWGVSGLWIAMATSMLVQGLLVTGRVRQGRWTSIKV